MDLDPMLISGKYWKIKLNRYETKARIGAYQHERLLPQRLRLNVSVYVEKGSAPVNELSEVLGGTSLTNGTDCSGFTQSVLANFGISISRTAASQSGGGTAVDMSNLQPGDLLFYDNGSGIGHVSMYIGNGQVVHASNEQTGIIVSSVDYRTACAARSYF